ncbi:MAG: hypothetical protein HOW73_15740 [Polyangiaceae bacterium]|nr:hypothetical protein [Polyangiaceae bacterium]
MRLSPVPSEVAHAGLRALKTVCAISRGIDPLEAQFIDGLQRHLLGTSFDIASLEPITGEELARAVPPGEFRERIIGGMVVAACIDGEASPAEIAVIEAFSKALDVDSPVLKTGRHLANQQLLGARVDIARRAMMGYKVRGVLREDGLPGLVRQMLPMLGVSNDDTAARYRALESYAAGTLGRGYYDFVTSNQFSFPGEKYAGPEIIVIHDVLHVLGGYGTTAEEEVQVAAFQAACHHVDQFHSLLFAIAQFHLGVQMAPVSPPEKLKADPELMMKAFARGAKVSRDVWAELVPWDNFARPIDDIRNELNIEPR